MQRIRTTSVCSPSAYERHYCDNPSAMATGPPVRLAASTPIHHRRSACCAMPSHFPLNPHGISSVMSCQNAKSAAATDCMQHAAPPRKPAGPLFPRCKLYTSPLLYVTTRHFEKGQSTRTFPGRPTLGVTGRAGRGASVDPNGLDGGFASDHLLPALLARCRQASVRRGAEPQAGRQATRGPIIRRAIWPAAPNKPQSSMKLFSRSRSPTLDN
ncbi:hypothetical protein IWZ01DRAFT_178040 [Phyllosticta capitalensis]